MLPRVVIDCSPLLVRSAGVKTYMHHWARSLQKVDAKNIRHFPVSGLKELNHASRVWQNGRGLFVLQAWNRLPQAIIDRLAAQWDVFHASNLVRRIPRGSLLSATVHDFTASLFPEFHTASQVTADHEFADRVLRPAAGLLAVSEATRADAIRILNLHPDKIRVVYPGVPESYRDVSPAAVHRARAVYSLPSRYFLYSGSIEPRKNIDTLLDAWMSLSSLFRKENRLVLAGMSGWKSAATQRRLAQGAREDAGVRWLGYVPESFMPGLTAGALALVYPSRYEGFGIPVAQAMAAGCPVITSNVSSLPEVAGGAALLVDPLSQSDIAAAIRRVAESPALRDQLAAAGIVRARAFTWPAAAQQSMQYFSDLAGAQR